MVFKSDETDEPGILGELYENVDIACFSLLSAGEGPEQSQGFDPVVARKLVYVLLEDLPDARDICFCAAVIANCFSRPTAP